MYAASQAILGIKPDYDGLMVDPHLPKDINKVQVVRIFRNVKYNITIENSGSGKYEMIVDGAKVSGNIIPYQKTNKEINVIVRI